MSYLAKKTVQDFIQDWKGKMEVLETDTKNYLAKLSDAVDQAESSAKKAVAIEQSMDDSKKVINKMLEDVAALRTSVASLHAELRTQTTSCSSQGTATGPSEQPIPDVSAAAEDAEAAARLRDKIDSPNE